MAVGLGVGSALTVGTSVPVPLGAGVREAWATGVGQENWEDAVSDWDSFVLLGILLKQEIPKGFRLKEAPFGLLPELFLVDSERNEGKPIKGK